MSIEHLIFKYINEERSLNKKPRLNWDSYLSNIAKKHSDDMVKQDYFSTIDKESLNPTQRAKNNKYPFSKTTNTTYSVLENIGKVQVEKDETNEETTQLEKLAESQVKLWLKQKIYRDNLLSDKIHQCGVGVTYDGKNYISTVDLI